MSGWLLASYVALWVIVIAIAILLLVVLRQLGLIYVSMDSSGNIHLDEGPKQGSVVPAFEGVDGVTGAPLRVPDSRSDLTLLLFASSHCSICVDSVRGASEVAKQYPASVVVIGTDGEDAFSNDQLKAAVQPPLLFMTSTEKHAEMSIRSTPQAVVLDRSGIVLEKAIVNHAAHLRELLDHAQVKIGLGSIQTKIAM